jgi:hypothetical protein
MKVVLDSNILIADFNLQTPNFTVLFESSRNKRIDLFIPQVVLDEVVNKYEQQISKMYTEITTQIKKYNKLTSNSFENPIATNSIQESVNTYRDKINGIFEENAITILPYPVVDHKVLARKAMLSKKPFNSNEKGYRDNLIWENIKKIISDENPDAIVSPELVFITGNYKDFSGKSNELHKELLEELVDENKSEDIVLYESLGEFNEKVSKLYYQEVVKFKERLENQDFWDFDLKSVIEIFLFEDFVGSEFHNYRHFVPYANDSPTVYTINEDFKINITSVKQISSTEFLIDVDFNLESHLTYFIDKHNYWSSEDDDFSVIDLDWNDHVVFVESEVLIPISISLIIDAELNCKSIEINKIDDDYQ